MLHVDLERSAAFVAPSAVEGLTEKTRRAHEALVTGSGAGSQWLGWRRILAEPNDALLEELTAVAAEIRSRADVLLCIGIGGSYLGAEAVIQSLSPYFQPTQSDGHSSGESLFANEEGGSKGVRVLFAGHHLSGAYLEQLLAHLEGQSVYVNVISKSGTTLEPGVAFRVIRQWMNHHFEDADRRIIATTDSSKGALRALANSCGLRTFEIPDDVGGRFSVLTPVGLLPIASAGFDIRRLFYGAVSMMKEIDQTPDHPALAYASRRYALHESGYVTEVMSMFEPRLQGIGSWWQQLFGESEGKEHLGLFPATCVFTTDLHSLGQYLQDGRRNLVETFLDIDHDRTHMQVPSDPGDVDGNGADGLAFVAGKSFADMTRAALEGTMQAHLDGGVPVHRIVLNRLDEDVLGGLIYFFEHVVAVSGYLLGINPFDQPGVEAYKKAMYSRLGR